MHSLSSLCAFGLIVIVAILLPMSFAHVVVLEMLYFRLRRRHPDYYKSIGEPSLFMNNSISKSGNSYRYLMDKDYLVVQDQRAVDLGNWSRLMLVAGITLFITGVVLFAGLAISIR